MSTHTPERDAVQSSRGRSASRPLSRRFLLHLCALAHRGRSLPVDLRLFSERGLLHSLLPLRGAAHMRPLALVRGAFRHVREPLPLVREPLPLVREPLPLVR